MHCEHMPSLKCNTFFSFVHDKCHLIWSSSFCWTPYALAMTYGFPMSLLKAFSDEMWCVTFTTVYISRQLLHFPSSHASQHEGYGPIHWTETLQNKMSKRDKWVQSSFAVDSIQMSWIRWTLEPNAFNKKKILFYLSCLSHSHSHIERLTV